MEVYTATDGHGPCHLKVALGWTGALQVELIEPISGNLRHYLEYLPVDERDLSPRHHHVCMRVTDWSKTRAEVDERRWLIAYEGAVEGCKFIYIDARESLGHYVEYLWMSPELWAATGGP
jgi:Glyoxalase/Bleomycin resistance protein/Dioxygenase superfamily